MQTTIAIQSQRYTDVADYLGLLRNDTKDQEGKVVETLGIEIDTDEMTARLSTKKVAKARRLIAEALTVSSLTQL